MYIGKEWEWWQSAEHRTEEEVCCTTASKSSVNKAEILFMCMGIFVYLQMVNAKNVT